jgi:hypothetical protein
VPSHDGFPWLLVNGRFLVRFDGQHFAGFEKPGNIRAFALAPNGDLRLGTTDHLERIPAEALNQFGRFRWRQRLGSARFFVVYLLQRSVEITQQTKRG